MRVLRQLGVGAKLAAATVLALLLAGVPIERARRARHGSGAARGAQPRAPPSTPALARSRRTLLLGDGRS